MGIIKLLLTTALTVSAASGPKKLPIFEPTPLVEDFPTCTVVYTSTTIVPPWEDFNSHITVSTVMQGQMEEGKPLLLSDGSHVFMIWLDCK